MYLQEILRKRHPPVAAHGVPAEQAATRRKVDVKVEDVGFTIEDRFVVGYGLDYAEQYRNLPHIAVMEPLITRATALAHLYPRACWRQRSPPRDPASSADGLLPPSGPLPLTIVFCTSSPRVT